MWNSLNYLPALLDQREELFRERSPCTHDRGLSVSEDHHSFLIEASVPGLKPQDIHITMNHGKLWIKGEKVEGANDKSRKYYRKANYAYSYCIALPDMIDQTMEAEATCADGIVKVVLQKKKEGEETKRIPVR